jgi:hypothetical protein
MSRGSAIIRLPTKNLLCKKVVVVGVGVGVAAAAAAAAARRLASQRLAEEAVGEVASRTAAPTWQIRTQVTYT